MLSSLFGQLLVSFLLELEYQVLMNVTVSLAVKLIGLD